MKYSEFKIAISQEWQQEIVIAELSELGFESFTQDDENVFGYIPEKECKNNLSAIEEYLNSYRYSAKEIADDTNWNAEWESNFAPIIVGDDCCVRAPFHDLGREFKYDIVIMPKMSFGTGHHATTHLMIEAILENDFTAMKGIDMGSGTGVLAILAAMRGAVAVDAIDIDEWAFENCKENIDSNGTSQVVAKLGDASLLARDENADFMLANINRNILIADMERYCLSLRSGGIIFFSGFLSIDVPVIEETAAKNGLYTVNKREKDGWNLVICKKR